MGNGLAEKYCLTEETKKVRLDGTTCVLHRIKALRAIPAYGVEAGDLGGWVENEANLSQHDNSWVADDACVCNGAYVFGNARMRGNSKAWGGAKLYSNAQTNDRAVVCNGAIIETGGEIRDRAVVSGNTSVTCSLIGGKSVVADGGRVFMQTITA